MAEAIYHAPNGRVSPAAYLPTQMPADFLRPIVIGDRDCPVWRARQIAAEVSVAADNLAIAEARIAWLRDQHRRDLWNGRTYGTHKGRIAALAQAAYWRGQLANWLRWARHFTALIQAPVATLAEAA